MMVSPTNPDEGQVLFWITEEDGREFATCAAATFRAAMTERDELRAENKLLRLRGDTFFEALKECNRVHAENERLRAALEQISRESGQVCPDFETCSHGPCQGSLAGKLLALEALATPASGQ